LETATLLLDNLELFLRIVEKGGMASAGREMGLSPASVSERLAALEKHYGARLLTRTTRSISLTDEGCEMVAGARRILAEAQELEARIRLGTETISGAVHIAAPNDLGQSQIAPLLDDFQSRHPDISIDLTFSDGYIDLVGQGIDLAIRFGDLADSTLRSKKLGSNRRIVCAAPDYLKDNSTPKHPSELQNHNCLLMRFGDQVENEWRFAIDGKEKRCRVRGNRIANDGSLVRQWCLTGYGIALKSQWDIEPHLKSGKLIPLLQKYEPAPTRLQMVYPSGAIQPRRVRFLMDHLTEVFAKT